LHHKNKTILDFLFQLDVWVVSFFSTEEHGLLLQDSFPLPSLYEVLLGIDVPHYYFAKKVRASVSIPSPPQNFPSLGFKCHQTEPAVGSANPMAVVTVV